MKSICIDKLRQAYLKEIHEHIDQKEILIYGAGIYAKKLHTFLVDNALPVHGFAVSRAAGNLDSINGLPVQELNTWLLDGAGRYLFLIGAVRPASDEISRILRAISGLDIVEAPPCFDVMLDEAFSRPVMEITPMAGCSINCRFCPQKAFLAKYFSSKRPKEMSFGDFKTCLDKTPQNLMVDFSGFVEPFLANDTIRMMKYAAEKGRDIRLFTTLVGLSKEGFKEIEDIPFRMFVLHLPDEQHYAHIPVTDEYLELLEMVAAKVKADGERLVDVANCQAAPDRRAAAVLKNKVPISWSLVDRAGNLEESEALSSVRHLSGRIFCRRALNLDHNVLLPSGEVVLCCMDFAMQHVLGNLLAEDESYAGIMAGKEMQQVKESLQRDGTSLCRKCTSAEKAVALA